MNRFWLFSLRLIANVWLSLMMSDELVAHSGHGHDRPSQEATRRWHSETGEFAVAGVFVALKDGCIQIRQADDSLRSLPMANVCELDQQWVERRMEEIRELNRQQFQRLVSSHPNTSSEGTLIEQAFAPFAENKVLTVRSDDRYLYVESDGIPDHPMMVGIRSWQQQVPLPQPYFGQNAWRIPLHPVSAKRPVSAKGRFLRGAIALAVNGVPIFNPLNNRGEDAYLFGELDEFGGHCGRADDYHYHLPPVHLQETVGRGLPIAYALDGYPIYGYDEPDGSPVVALDSIHGHKDEHGDYHYHASKSYPYLNGGFYGVITERGGQVDPQPRAEPVRPDLRPLRGATIVRFESIDRDRYLLEYMWLGQRYIVRYSLGDRGSVQFSFEDPSGKITTEKYQQRPTPGNTFDVRRFLTSRIRKPTDR